MAQTICMLDKASFVAKHAASVTCFPTSIKSSDMIGCQKNRRCVRSLLTRPLLPARPLGDSDGVTAWVMVGAQRGAMLDARRDGIACNGSRRRFSETSDGYFGTWMRHSCGRYWHSLLRLQKGLATRTLKKQFGLPKARWPSRR
eukprot:6211101-Pleurochrysis_carterae.AAC.1